MSAQSETATKRAAGTQMPFFEKYLSAWVALCIVVGIVLGRLLPQAFDALGAMEIARVNLPVAVLIWLMILPMLLKIDFNSLREVNVWGIWQLIRNGMVIVLAAGALAWTNWRLFLAVAWLGPVLLGSLPHTRSVCAVMKLQWPKPRLSWAAA